MADAGWIAPDGEQVVLVDNVRIDIDGKKNVYSEKGKRLGHYKK